MNNYIFTFGQNHQTLYGKQLKNCYVTVSAKNYGSAREIFCKHFSKPILGSYDKFAFQYEEKEFISSKYFTLYIEGNLLSLNTNENGDLLKNSVLDRIIEKCKK